MQAPVNLIPGGFCHLSVPSANEPVQMHAQAAQPRKALDACMTCRCHAQHVQELETGAQPVVYADWLHASGQPTILIYGHYDVQVQALQCCLASVHASLLPNAHLCFAASLVHCICPACSMPNTI